MRSLLRSLKSRQSRILFILFLFCAFTFRLIYGVCAEFWFEDEIQIYLLGLKYFSTGHWPFFGPDIVYSESQLPGALQSLLVGLPFYVLKIPEAPYILLNGLSFAAIGILGKFVRKRIPGLPKWFVWTWLFTAPWLLNFSTHVVNPSYVLPFSILFFVSFFELLPKLSVGMFQARTSFLWMGVALIGIFQLHMSWVLLLPFILLAGYLHIKQSELKNILINLAYFLSGCLISGSVLIPTYMEYGFGLGTGGTASNLTFNAQNVKEIGTVIIRYVSFGSFESARFIGTNTAARLKFLTDYWWAVPFVVFTVLVGFFQVLWLLFSVFRTLDFQEWKEIKLLVASSSILIWISFFFSIKGPSSHTFYIMLPLMMIYSFYCWETLLKKGWIRKMAAVFLFSGFIFNCCVAHNNFTTKSMYMDREKPLNAIRKKNYRQLGERRAYDRNH